MLKIERNRKKIEKFKKETKTKKTKNTKAYAWRKNLYKYAMMTKKKCSTQRSSKIPQIVSTKF